MNEKNVLFTVLSILSAAIHKTDALKPLGRQINPILHQSTLIMKEKNDRHNFQFSYFLTIACGTSAFNAL